MIRTAVELFLDLAYPGAARWRAPKIDLASAQSVDEALTHFDEESNAAATDGERPVPRYVLRLGNARYPHMKLVLEESILEHEFAFSVDTHDDLKVSPTAPDYERWNAVRDHNRLLAEDIEGAWREARVPTVRDLKSRIGRVERISEDDHSVLVVDDDPAICDAIRELLERAGLEVRTAPNGKIALDKVAERRPALILMDYQMPEMDGVTCCEALKGDEATQDIPVLLATRSQVDLASLTYADGFLVKPYRQDVLFSLVRKLLA